MSGTPDLASDVFYLLLLALPVSALFARRLPARQLVLMALAWAAIFVVVLAVSATDMVAGLAHRFQPVRAEGSPTRIAAGRDGHYVADTHLNGVRIAMLIDTGASTTALSERSARNVGVKLGSGGFPVVIRTANGMVDAERAVIETVRVGGVTMANLPVIVSPAFGETDVLGMNFLSRLRRWRVEDGEMILEP